MDTAHEYWDARIAKEQLRVKDQNRTRATRAFAYRVGFLMAGQDAVFFKT
jgi:hypothetical protein